MTKAMRRGRWSTMRTGAIPGVNRSEFGRRARACLEALFLLLSFAAGGA